MNRLDASQEMASRMLLLAARLFAERGVIREIQLQQARVVKGRRTARTVHSTAREVRGPRLELTQTVPSEGRRY